MVMGGSIVHVVIRGREIIRSKIEGKQLSTNVYLLELFKW